MNALIKLKYCQTFKELSIERTSRTDSRVSAALGMFAIWCNNSETIHLLLNEILPKDIRVFGC